MKKFYSFLLAIPVVISMAFATSCVDPAPTPDPIPTQKEPTIILEEYISASTYNSGGVMAKVTNADKIKYTHYKRGERPTDVSAIEWKELPIQADGSYEILIKDLPTSLTDRSTYVVEAFACLADAQTEPQTASFGTLLAKAVMVSDMKVSARAISFVATILTDYCDAYVVRIQGSSDFDQAAFLKDIEDGFETLLKEDGVIMENGYGQGLDPGKEYTIAIHAVRLTSDGKFKELAGDIQIIKHKTLDYELNQSEASVVMTIDLQSLTFAGVNAKITRADDQIGGCFIGAVKKSDIGEKTAETYIAESEWFYAQGQYAPNFNSANSFDVPTENQIQVSFKQLSANTEYVLFAIAYDKYGFIGKVVSSSVTTSPITFDDPATLTYVVTPAKDQAEVMVEFKENCSEVYFIKVPTIDNMTDQEAQETLLANSTLEFSDKWTSPGTQIIYGLQPDTEYDLFMLPKSSNGKFGKILKTSFATLSNKLVFDGISTLTVAIATPPEGRPNRNNVMVWYYGFTVNLTNATTYRYGVAAVEDFEGVVPTAKECAQLIHGTSGLLTQGTEPDFVPEFSIYNWKDVEAPYYAVFVPVDADGKFGTPVLNTVTVPKHTMNVTEKPEDPGVDPKNSIRRR